jgi:hypothetical protein
MFTSYSAVLVAQKSPLRPQKQKTRLFSVSWRLMKTPRISSLLDFARDLGLRAWQTGFLLDKAAPAVKAMLFDRMTAKLLVRLLAKVGLRGALASNIAGWILPVVVSRIIKLVLQTEAAERLQKHPTVTNVRQTLDELKNRLRRAVAPDFGSGAEIFDGPEPPRLEP